MPRMRIVAVCVASYMLVWIGAALTSIAFALAIDTAGQDTGDLGPLLSGFFIGALVFNVAWIFTMSAWLTRRGDIVRAHLGAVATPVVVVAALVVSLPLGVALGFAMPAATAWWASDPFR